MKANIKLCSIAGALLMLSACHSGSMGGGLTSAPIAQISGGVRVSAINVEVPRSLKVSEDNSIKPRADIVWHDDPYGDRYAQVKAVMEDGIARGVKSARGQVPVILDVQVQRFHAQTQHVRYSDYPSEHEIEFVLSGRDAKTGAVIIPPHKIDATFDAFGGQAAISADQNRITQKMRITERLEQVMAQELARYTAG